jgi:hypothetical protein
VPWHTPENERILRSLRRCVIFKRLDIATVVPTYHYFFPHDPLRDILQSWERQYLAYCEHMQVERSFEEYWADAVTIGRDSTRSNERIFRDEWAQLGLDPDLCIRFQDCIRRFTYYVQIFRQLDHVRKQSNVNAQDYAGMLSALAEILDLDKVADDSKL